MSSDFIHLRLHTEYSLSDGLIRIEDLVAHCVQHKMPAVAITDQVNLYAAVKFYQAAIAAGIKPILGADCWLHNSANEKQPFRFTLLCQNDAGYRNLTRLISRAYLEGQATSIPVIQKAWLEHSVDGLIALSGAREGDIGQALINDREPLAKEYLEYWLRLFPDRFYLDLQRTERAHEKKYLQGALHLAQKYSVPVVATNDVRFLSPEDFEAHEARVCINSGYTLNDPRRSRLYSPEQYLCSTAKMQTLFADIPQALQNSVEIAKRCNLELVLGQTFLPNFPIPEKMSPEDYLKQQAEEGLKNRLLMLPEEKEKSVYSDRLRIELDVINSMGFAGYFLIVADFIHWAKKNNIPVGPGRGSGAGSLVAYALQITDLDPLPYDLLFERFLNPERISMPDFDIDFCMDGRDRVIEYVTERYGRDAVCQIITFGSMAARGVVRDVGRILGYPYGMVDKLAKLIPFEIGITLETALKQEEELARRYDNEDEVKTLFDLARKLEGIARNVGKHAAGVVIAPSRLTDFTPLYCEAGGSVCVTQFDMDDIQTVGLVKFDFLGLRTLTIIDWAIQTINQQRKQRNETLIDIQQIPIDDPQTFQLLKSCATTAIFQLETRATKDLIKRLKPDCLEDIIALVALIRPGPQQSGMVDDYVNRKHGFAKVEVLHPLLEPILRQTYGIILYQEQVMQIAQVLAGYTLGAADLLRRAMGKKKPEEMAKQREIFITGAKERGISKETSTAIFDLMAKFADYGFNKSHSAAYALVSYQTAWLKAHYPAEFMSSVLSSDMDHTDKVVAFLDECRAMGLKILPPDINRSHYQFTVDADGAIVYGLGAIKGVGQAAIETILACRNKQGSFQSLADFCQHLDTRKVNKRVFESLIYSGTLDKLGTNRASLLASLEGVLQATEQQSQATKGGQMDLFGNVLSQMPVIKTLEEWPKAELLQREKESLGFYLSGHPMQRYDYELKHMVTGSLAEVHTARSSSVMVAGWIVGLRLLNTKRGDRMAIVTLEDQSARLELAVFSDTYAACKDFLQKDQLLIVEGEVSIDEFTGNQKIVARKCLDITTARESFAKHLRIKLKGTQIKPNTLDDLRQLLHPFCPGRCPVIIEYTHTDSTANLALGPNWRVKPKDDVINALNLAFGNDTVIVHYEND